MAAAQGKRKPGRPKGSTSPTARRARLAIRCSDEQLERWRRSAEAVGLELADWVRLELDRPDR